VSTKTLASQYVSDVSTLRLRDAEEAGGKGANMGELVAAVAVQFRRAQAPPRRYVARRCGPTRYSPSIWSA
jgi:hypothetical protein